MAKAEDAFQREGKRRAPDWDRLFELHDQFHRLLVATLAGPRLRVLLEGLRPHVDRYEYLYGPLLGPGYDATFAEHAAIIKAIAGGRADAAERAVRANWFQGAERLEKVVEHAGEPSFLRVLGALPGVATPRMIGAPPGATDQGSVTYALRNARASGVSRRQSHVVARHG